MNRSMKKLILVSYLLAGSFAGADVNLEGLLPSLESKSPQFRNMMVMAAAETRFRQYSGMLVQPPNRDPQAVAWLQATLVTPSDVGCRSVGLNYNCRSNVLEIIEGSDHLNPMSGDIKAVATRRVLAGDLASSAIGRLRVLKDMLLEFDCDSLEVTRDFFGRKQRVVLTHWYDTDRLQMRSKIFRVQP